MLYIALILIASGIICILYPVFTRPGKPRYTTRNDRYVPNFDSMTGAGRSEQDEHIMPRDGGGSDSNTEPGVLGELNESIDEDIPGVNGAAFKHAQDGLNAVLYEDSSHIIDYETGSNVIDSSLGEYKKLKRIGKGKIEVIKEGINFFIGKSFYRFDFYKIDRVKIGENYMALFLKGSSVVRLVLFDETESGIRSIITSIENYFSTAG